MPINLCELMAVVTYEVKLHSHKTDGPIRDHLTARATKRNAFRHKHLSREGFWMVQDLPQYGALRHGMHDYRASHRRGWTGKQRREVVLDPLKRASV